MFQRKFRLLQIEPTTRCNLSCVMCPWKGSHPRGRDMDMDLFRRLSEYFVHTDEVDFTGSGEPLMNENLAEMVRCCKASGCRVGFSTNGVLLTPDRMNGLLDAGLDWVAFSIDAATEETYGKIRVGACLTQVRENLEHMKSLKRSRKSDRPSLMIFFVMMQENYFELPLLIDMAVELGADFVVAKQIDVLARAEHYDKRIFDIDHLTHLSGSIRNVLDEARQKALAAHLKFRVYELSSTQNAVCEQNPLKTLFVSVDGIVSPCISLAYMSHRYFRGEKALTPTCRFGDLNQSGLWEILKSDDYVTFRKFFDDRIRHRFFYNTLSLLTNSLGLDLSEKLPLPPPGCRQCYSLYEN